MDGPGGLGDGIGAGESGEGAGVESCPARHERAASHYWEALLARGRNIICVDQGSNGEVNIVARVFATKSV